MSGRDHWRRLGGRIVALGLVLALGSCAAPAAPIAPTAPTGRAKGGETMPAGEWTEVESLAADQKYREASELVTQLLERARAAGDDEEWTRALIRRAQLETALGRFETTVEQLLEEPWPEAALERALLELFYAHALVTYHQSYSWEIRERERSVDDDTAAIERWTSEQIVAAANRAFARAWSSRARWGSDGRGRMAEHLDPNDYPPRIRGTLRDAVTYLWVELLADSSLWRPEHSEGVYRLDLELLLASGSRELAALDLTNPEAHPLLKLAVILDDLESWHRQSERPEAAFEARRVRVAKLASAFTRGDDRARLEADLERALDALGRGQKWWSMGMAELAALVRAREADDALVEARRVAFDGQRAHPGSLGGQRCRHLVAEIEAPDFNLESMAADAPEKRSLAVDHRNLGTLHFRAYAVDLPSEIEGSRDRWLLPAGRRIDQLLAGGRPLAEWSVDLPRPGDYRQHRTYVTPPLAAKGLYVIVASADAGFGAKSNKRHAVHLLLTDLVLLSRDRPDGLELTTRSGTSGRALPGVDVDLYRFDYQKGHQKVASRSSGRDGLARFRIRDPQRYASYFAIARAGDDLALSHPYWRGDRSEDADARTALIYTDRSVYRPRQEVLWKVVAYGGREGGFRTLEKATATVELRDANGELVASEEIETNEFGAASGAFELPAGRLLGSWSLKTSIGGGAAIQVEEYKRPTFEVSISDPADELRLNRPAEFEGEARYYFGLPLAGGEAVWRVTRVPVYPRWWFWAPPAREETIAAGAATIDAEGRFKIAFEPEADERDAARPGVTYRYRLSVDVTDDGGETRSASRVFRLGFVAVEASIDLGAGFLAPDRESALEIRRTDLDGAPRSGEGAWRLLELTQPAAAALPAELPPAAPEGRYSTAGDRLRPRWSGQYDPARVLDLWDDGAEVASGATEHGADGLARVELPRLAAGAYRLRYTTRDAFGAELEVDEELVVAADGEAPLALAAVASVEQRRVAVGGTARLLVLSGLEEQPIVIDLYRDGVAFERRRLDSAAGAQVISIPVDGELRGGFGYRLTLVRDHQVITLTGAVDVPWDDRRLEVSFATFRDQLRPGGRETWRIRLAGDDGAALAAGSAELLAYMYDRSLELFADHVPPDPLRLYPSRTAVGGLDTSLGTSTRNWVRSRGFAPLPPYPSLAGDRLKFLDGYPIGGLGSRGMPPMAEMRSLSMEGNDEVEEAITVTSESPLLHEATAEPAPPPDEPPADAPAEGGELRSDFSETAFWEPHLLLGDDGAVELEFTVPDSVTEWSVWVHGITRDLRSGSLETRTRTVKELLVRPYLPRFLREGDRAEIAVVVNNASDEPFEGTLDFRIEDAESGESLLAEFGLEPSASRGVAFSVAAGGGTELRFPLRAPARLGAVAVRVTAEAGEWSDGELRPLPLLPGRMHLAKSRFAALSGSDRRELEFAELAADDDPSRVDEQLVVTLDAQLFHGVLAALPYLADYPYECTEQLLNRFLSTGIVSSVFDEYPAVERLAAELSSRETPLAPWAADDPNRGMALEETPWLVTARGGEASDAGLVAVLDSRVARATRDGALAKLEAAQTASGGFPWWPGGPPSPYMTLYLLQGFSRALEFEVDVPRELVESAWRYLHGYYVGELVREALEEECCWEMVTFLNYVLSSYPDPSWTGGVFSDGERRRMLDFSFEHWREHSPLSKAQLALTLERAGRGDEARLVFDSVMDSARTTRDEGTFWAPEERSWLWYNDTIESHAWALRTLTELDPDDERRHGLVQWLFLNKKLNQWKSTRATAEVIYALVHYLEREGTLGAREELRVTVGPYERLFEYEPESFGPAVPHGRAMAGGELATPAGMGASQMRIPGDELEPAMARVVVEKATPGFAFASATWHFSTERLPEEASGDFFNVERRLFKRVNRGREWVLEPLADGALLEVGDQVEVELRVRSKHAAEYVHLRDPRAAGFEPESPLSRYKWDLGIGWYEEVRDSGTNFFFERLPVGEYTLRYRLRAAIAGEFKLAPATLQSMYAPEFTAYSAGETVEIEP